jgi:hypothetical protein
MLYDLRALWAQEAAFGSALSARNQILSLGFSPEWFVEIIYHAQIK